MASGPAQFGILSHLGGKFVATTTGIGAWSSIAGSLFVLSEAVPDPGGDTGSASRVPVDPSGTPAPSTGKYFLRVEYTTYEFDADDEVEICIVDPACAVCGGSSGSGSGSGASGSGDDPGGLCPPGLVDDGNGNCVYVGPCNCPPGFSLFLVGVTPDLTPIYKCRDNFTGSIIRNCNEDPTNPGNGPGGGSGGGGAAPSLTVELTTFEVPDTMTAVSVRCVDVTTCEVCA